MTTVVGDVQVERRYYRCSTCRTSHVPYDRWAGLGPDMLSPGATRMAALAGSSWSFDLASERLKQLCGVRISDQTIRRASQASGEAARQWLIDKPEAAVKLNDAQGNLEFSTDGAKINTVEGWREIRLNIFAKRPAGEPAGATQWAERRLPDPTARLAFAHIAAAHELGPQWSAMAERLNAPGGRQMSVVADGAPWIWNQANEHLPQAEQIVDIFHVSEHIHAAGRAMFSDDQQARAWAQEQLLDLLHSHPLIYLRRLEALRTAATDPPHRQALDALHRYLQPNFDRLHYADRLARGLPIGSGMVEGGCKTVVGKRLRANNARWRPEHAQQLAALCCLHYNDQWSTFWSQAA